VSNSLDFILILPSIEVYKNREQQQVNFPITKSAADAVSFLLPNFLENSNQANNRQEILTRIREKGHLVFLQKDIF
jgi:hypothetical protein